MYWRGWGTSEGRKGEKGVAGETRLQAKDREWSDDSLSPLTAQQLPAPETPGHLRALYRRIKLPLRRSVSRTRDPPPWNRSPTQHSSARSTGIGSFAYDAVESNGLTEKQPTPEEKDRSALKVTTGSRAR